MMSQIILVAATEQFAEHATLSMASHPHVVLMRYVDPVDPAHLDELVEKLAAQSPLVVALGPLLQVNHQMRIAELIDRDHHEMSVVMVGDLSPEQWHYALRAGARDVLSPEDDAATIKRALEHAVNVSLQRRSALQSAMTLLPATPTSGQMITVVSPKGGSGKTVTSTNLAVALAQEAPGRVVLVDFDLQFGDVAMALHIEPEFTIANAVRGPLDAATLRAQLVKHSSGLMVLCAPDQPEEAEDISVESAKDLLAAMARDFDYVVVDTGAGLDDVTIAAIEAASDVVFVSSTDVPSVRGVHKLIDILDRLQLRSQRRHLVLNRSDARVGLLANDISTTTGLPVAMTIPSSRAVPVAMNQGVSLVESNARSPITRALQAFAASFTDRSGAADVKGGRNRKSVR
jgi:pilus assembly protein CpaE